MEDFEYNENYKKQKRNKKPKNKNFEIIEGKTIKKDKWVIVRENRAYEDKNIRNEKRKEKRIKDNNYKNTENLRKVLYDTLKNRYKSTKIENLVGCNVSFLKEYIASKFQIGMSWEIFCNSDLIQIDHIIPCCNFNLTDPEQQKLCFHYTNLQPLWWWQNASKGNRKTWTSIGELFNESA